MLVLFWLFDILCVVGCCLWLLLDCVADGPFCGWGSCWLICGLGLFVGCCLLH